MKCVSLFPDIRPSYFKKVSIIINLTAYMQKNLEISSWLKFLGLLILCLFSTFFTAFAQRESLIISKSIDWTAFEKTSPASSDGQFLYAKNCFSEPSKNQIPVYVEVFNSKGKSLSAIKLLDYRLSPLPSVPEKWKKHIGSEPILEAQTLWERGEERMRIKFFPIVYQNGNYAIVKSFRFEWTTDVAHKPLNKQSFAAHSVLANGEWLKIAVMQSGVQRLDASFFKNAGFDISQINPKKISVYGSGGGMLAQAISTFRYDDLKENPCFFSGESDGVFNANDYLLFFGQAQNDIWKYSLTDKHYYHEGNIYSDTTYYFIRIGNSTDNDGARVAINNSVVTTDTLVSDFDFLYVKEEEKYNLVKSGRNWVGQLFDLETNQGVLSLNIPGYNSSAPIFIRSSALARSFVNSQFDVSANGTFLLTHHMPAVPTDYEYYACDPDIQNASFFSTDGSVNLQYSFNKPSSESIAWLDYVEIQTRANLRNSNGNFIFTDASAVGKGRTVKYQVQSPRNMRVWDITRISEPFEIIGNFDANQGQFQFAIASDSLRRFLLFDGTTFNRPINIGKVPNQDLHGLAAAEHIIIAHPAFMPQALKLAEFHQKNNSFRTVVVNVHDIYNEFSSGSQDISAIRDFIRLMFKKANTINDQPKYITLFGRASYDYKYRFSSNTNFIPTFESKASYNFTDSYNSDDYYALIDDNEGHWDSDTDPDEMLDVGIGRLPVKNSEEADIMLDKVEKYSSKEAYGDWRNRMVFVSDDEDNNEHQIQSNKMANNVLNNYMRFNVQKIFIDAYKEITGAGGKRNPDAQADIVRAVQKGCLMINYTGHGGEVGWSHKRILNTDDIQSWSNVNTLPLFITATCEFSRFDDPSRNAAGEMTLLNPNGGAIALLTTVRLVYVSDNNSLNNTFYQHCGIDSTSQLMPNYFGDIMRNTKNAYNSKNTRNFTLLGNPAIALAYPRYFVRPTSINKQILNGINDTIKALSHVEISGEIVKENGTLINDFNGVIYPTIFDKMTNYKTLANNLTSPQMDFQMQNNIIYKGKADVKQGKFSFSFIVPKDISYEFGKGKFSFYAHTDDMDASGYYDNFIVGGTGGATGSDKTGPSIQLYMNDKQFVNGGICGNSPEFIAVLKDSSGINTVGRGIGRNLMATIHTVSLANSTTSSNDQSISLNDYYQSDINSYQSGEVHYHFNHLDAGKYELKMSAYDVYNNASESVLTFEVKGDEKMELDHVLNYPNPFTTNTSFHFDHNHAGEDLNVQVQIFTINGHLIKTLQQYIPQASAHVSTITWDGKDTYGDAIGKGVYVYKLRVQSASGKYSESIQKLVLL